MNGNMEFRRARREEAEEILQLYRSLIGTEYCVWTENYPTEREVEFDLSRNALFCLYERMPEPDEREQGARLSEEQTAGHLPVNFVRSLPSNIYYGGSSDGRHSLMQYPCQGSSKKWIFFWTLRQPSHADTENLYSLMTSCGYDDGPGPADHNIVKNWGMRAAKIVEL